MNTDLVPSKEGIEDKAGVRQLVVCQGEGLGNAAGVGETGFAEVRVHDVVTGTIGGAPGVFVAYNGEWRVGQVILPT